MIVTVRASELAKELVFLEKIITKKSTLPVLQNVFLQAHDGWLHLATTDLEIGLTTACQAKTVEHGAVTLPVLKLLEIVRSLEGAEMTITLDAKHKIHLTSGIFHSRLQMMPVEDFPVLPSPIDLTSTTLDRAAFLDMLSKTRFATVDDQRFFMNGALLVLDENQMLMVAVDGKRLALMTTPREGAQQPSALLPTKAMDLMIALLTESSAAGISFIQSDRHLFFEIDGRLLISRTIDGKFPAWEKIRPTDYVHSAMVGRAGLLTVVQRALLIGDVLTLTVNENAIGIAATSTEIGDADEAVPCVYAGPEITITLRGAYLVDVLTAATGASVSLTFKDKSHPLLVTDGAYQNVIMVIAKV